MISSFVVLLAQIVEFFKFLIFIRIILSWFPNIDWWKQPFKLLDNLTEPVLAPFRALIPPIAGLDLSPIVLFIFLGMVKYILLTIPGML